VDGAKGKKEGGNARPEDEISAQEPAARKLIFKGTKRTESLKQDNI
jgi:hypothetical protein